LILYSENRVILSSAVLSQLIIRVTLTTEQQIDVQGHSRSSTVVDDLEWPWTLSCMTHIYDSLLVICCYLYSISHRFRDIASRSRKQLISSFRAPIELTHSNFIFKLTTLTVETPAALQWKLSDPIRSYFVCIVIHSPHRRQTTSYNKSETLQCICNVPLKTESFYDDLIRSKAIRHGLNGRLMSASLAFFVVACRVVSIKISWKILVYFKLPWKPQILQLNSW